MTEHETPAVPESPEAAPAIPEAPAAPAAVIAPPSIGSEAAATAPAPRPRGKRSPDGKWWLGTGRRKSAIARVRMTGGSGKFIVNGKPYDEFFCVERDRNDIMKVLRETRTEGTVDIEASVLGGGTTGQAGAIILGLARALSTYDTSLEGILRDHGFLTRDPREVERKKYGQAGARRRFQFSKR